MPSVEIKRIYTKSNCIQGVMFINGKPECCTLELPDNNNQKNISCIPVGKYSVKKHLSPTFGNVFLIENVVGRTDILIHQGNTAEDSKGCVLVGERFGVLDDNPAVLASRDALAKIKNLLPNSFSLVIR